MDCPQEHVPPVDWMPWIITGLDLIAGFARALRREELDSGPPVLNWGRGTMVPLIAYGMA